MGCRISAPCHPESPNSGNDDPQLRQRRRPPRGTNVHPRHHPRLQPSAETTSSQRPAEETTAFRQYTVSELKAATDAFSQQNLLSIGGGQLPNYTYSGRLPGGQRIAVKRISFAAWRDERQFREAAITAGRLRHERLVNLIGYCCDDGERTLVAEFMPNDSLATHLFKFKSTTMQWSMCFKVACYIAEALEYCINEEQALYYDLNPYKVLFDEAGNPCLSCFGLVKNWRDRRCYSTNIAYTPPDCVNGKVTHKSMIFSFGIVLRELLSGKKITEDEGMQMILGQHIPIIHNSCLKGEYSTIEANALKELASQCLQYDPKDRPTVKDVIATFAQFQNNAGAPSHAMARIEEQDKTPSIQEIQKQDKTPSIQETQKQDKTPPSPHPTSFPLVEAVAKMDLTTNHEILVLADYKGT